jgi:uncharacterized protein YjbI with pentapeptide repeats
MASLFSILAAATKDLGLSKPPAPVREENKPILSGDAKILHDNVTEALARAHTAAEARAASQPGATNKFDMTDYFIAAQEMVENGANLTTATMANFAGQRITNAQINKADIEKPPEAIRMAATLRAMQSAATTGRPAKLSDVLKEVQAIRQSGARIDSSPQNLDQMRSQMADLANIHGIDDFKHIYDLDGTLSINDFFETIDHHIDFKGTIFSEVTFHPADTLMHNSKNDDGKDSGVALTEGASFNNVVFDGMGADDHLVLKQGKYSEITLKDINRGHVHVTDGTRIDGIDVKGMHAEFSLGKNAFVGGMIVDKETRILTFTMAEGATMAHADLGKAIISPAGVMRNTNWEDIKVGGGLRDVDLSGSSFKSVTFDGTDLKDTNFTGSTLKDVTFKNMTAEQLKALDLSGVKSFDGVTVTMNGKDKPINSAKEFELMKFASASGITIPSWESTKVATQAPQAANT